MSAYGSETPVKEPEAMLTPEETKRLLERAEETRPNGDSLGTRYPPENGYPTDYLYGTAAQIPFEGLEDKIWDIEYSGCLDTEELAGGSMKETAYSPEHNLVFQRIDPDIITEFDEKLAQELTALHNNQVLQEHNNVELVTDYELRFTFTNGKPTPVRVGEYRNLVSYQELPEYENLPGQTDLKEEFAEAGLVVGQLMRDGEVAYAEPIHDWEQNISKNRAYDPLRDTVVITDVGELSENQFAENLNNGRCMEDFLFKDPTEAPFSSQREFLKDHSILDEMEEYFVAVEDEPLSELLVPDVSVEEYKSRQTTGA